MFARHSTTSDNATIAHKWAQQNKEQGKAKGGNVFYSGATIYSYGYHFAMATFITPNTVAINYDNYSPTTSSHQRYVKDAVSHKTCVYLPTKIVNALAKLNEYDKEHKKAASKFFIKGIIELLESEQNDIKELFKRNKRVGRLHIEAIEKFNRLLSNVKHLAEILKFKIPAKFKDIGTDHKTYGAFLEKYYNAQNAKQEKRDAKQLAEKKEALELAMEALPYWLSNSSPIKDVDRLRRASMYNLPKTYMRVNGDNIETTRGAKFPISDAQHVFKRVQHYKLNGLTYPNNAPECDNILKLGNYKVDRIDENGNVRAGCHYVEWEQIVIAAKQLKLV